MTQLLAKGSHLSKLVLDLAVIVAVQNTGIMNALMLESKKVGQNNRVLTVEHKSRPVAYVRTAVKGPRRSREQIRTEVPLSAKRNVVVGHRKRHRRLGGGRRRGGRRRIPLGGPRGRAGTEAQLARAMSMLGAG